MPDPFVLCNGDGALRLWRLGTREGQNHDVFKFLCLSHSIVLCLRRSRAGVALSRFWRDGLRPNSGEYVAGAGRMGEVLILRGSMLGVRDRWRRYAEFAINEYPRTRSNHC